MTFRTLGLAMVALLLLAAPATAADPQIIEAPANQQIDVYSEVNVSGTVFVQIQAQAGEPCANFWWIKWPFGSVEQLGRFCAFAKFEVPSTFSGSVGAKLRAGGNPNNLMMAVSGNEAVAHSATLHFP